MSRPSPVSCRQISKCEIAFLNPRILILPFLEAFHLPNLSGTFFLSLYTSAVNPYCHAGFGAKEEGIRTRKNMVYHWPPSVSTSKQEREIEEKQEELFWFIGQYITLKDAQAITTFYLRPGATLCRFFFFIIIIIFVLFFSIFFFLPLCSPQYTESRRCDRELTARTSADNACVTVDTDTYAASAPAAGLSNTKRFCKGEASSSNTLIFMNLYHCLMMAV